MTFESLFKPGGEKSEEEVVNERKVEEIQKKIEEKTTDSETAEFFDEKDKFNLQILESNPETDLNTALKISRRLMCLIKENPRLITKKVNFFHSESD